MKRSEIRQLVLASVLLATVFQPIAFADPHPTEVFWGDTHVHTALSGDAYAGGVRLTPDTAYRFARGEAVATNTGQQAQLARPLDFIVVADHANNIGAAYYREQYSNDPKFRDSALGKAWLAARERLAAGHLDDESLDQGNLLPAHRSWQASFREPGFRSSVWQRVTSAADRHNQPGKFTAFIGYEWTPSSEEGSSQHRVIVFADDADRADQILPFTSYDSAHEEELWRSLDRYETSTGGRAISIPHNSNLTFGRMFALTDSYGQPLTSAYAKTRARFEPIVEATQIKGDSETHPFLSPEDEFADFERWNGWTGWKNGGLRNGVPMRIRPNDLIPFEYVRSALQLGVGLKQSLGTNPFKFGVIGSTDSHTALATADEDNFWGKTAPAEPSAKRIFNASAATNWQMNAAGYAAVWAHENTRESIFDALLRRETYATTGPRMRVRMFAGFDFGANDLDAEDLAVPGYTKGVPMGGDLVARGSDAPVFLLSAGKDPSGANLDRIQIIKGWTQQGQRREKVYNAVLSDGRSVDEHGKTSPVGSTVDQSNASYTNTIGDVELRGVWRDPDFVPGQSAVYYARVLQIPTPRWTLYDKVRYSLQDLPDDIPLVIQERAYTSAIWYVPPN
jgi:hypothetical protein